MLRNSARRILLGMVAALMIATTAAAGAPETKGPDSAPATPGTTATTTARAATAAAVCVAGTASCPIRISFAAGAYSGQARGRLTAIGSQAWFVIRVRAGQVMIVIVEGRGPTRGIVIAPNGRSVGQPGGRVFDGPVSSSGDYRIRVTESPMGEAWSGPVDVVAVVY